MTVSLAFVYTATSNLVEPICKSVSCQKTLEYWANVPDSDHRWSGIREVTELLSH